MTEKPKSFFLSPCKTCKKEVANSAKTCPHCGVKNPTVTWKHQAASILIILLVLGYCVRQTDDKTKLTPESPPVVQQSQAPEAPPIITEVPQSTIEDVQRSYELAQERMKLLKDLDTVLEPILAVPNQIIITDDLLTAKKFAKDLSYTAYASDMPNIDKEIADAFFKMNNALGGTAAAVEKRIDSAIELSSGTKNPVKAAEKFSSAKNEYERRLAEFDKHSQFISEWLTIKSP